MIIKEEDWDSIGNAKKEEIGACEVCGKKVEHSELCARHLQYGDKVDEKYMLIVCKRCNYMFHLAELEELRKLEELNDGVLKEVKELEKKFLTEVVHPVMAEYMEKRALITAEAILQAVGKNKTKKRPEIDMLFKHPNLYGDKEVSDLCKKAKAWDGSKYAPLTKEMKETLL